MGRRGTEIVDRKRARASPQWRLAGGQEAMAAGSVIVLLCLACAGSAWAQSSKPTVRHHRVRVEEGLSTAIARAEAAIDKKDYATAEQALHEAIKQDANSYRAWFDLGFVYTALHRDADAIAAYRKSVAANPNVFESNLNLGLMLARSTDPEAAKYLRAATGLKPSAKPEEGLYRAWVSLGQVLEDKEPREAIAAFRKAAELKPDDSEAHLMAAAVAEKTGDLASAEQEYKAAAARDPKSADALAGLAYIYSKTQRLPEAEDELRKYVTLDAQSAKAHLQLGRVLAGEGKTDEAEAEIEKALQLSPADAQAEREIAMLYAANKQFAKAEPHFRAALQKQPNDAELHHRLGTALLEQRKFAEAQKELLAAVNLKPDLGIAYGDLALAASENKDYPLTIKALDARARYLPEIPATLFLRATAYDHLGAHKEAAASYHRFLAAANGKFPDQEWQARHRLIAIEPKR
jgi:Tfp pilus assembly protein PilF